MAKDSFLMYTEWANQVIRLSDEQAGVLLKSIFAYNKGEPMPAMDDKTDMCFSFIQGQLDRDSRKYENVCEKRREAGKKGGEANATKRKQMLPIANFGKQTVANQADNDNEYENDNDNDNDDDLKKEKRKKIIDDAERKRLEERDRILEEDGYAERHEGAGEVYFNPTIKLGMKSAPSSHGTMSQEERERILKRLEDFQKRKEG